MPVNTHEAAEAGRWAFLIALISLAVGLPLLILVVGGIFTKFRNVTKLLPWTVVGGVIVGEDHRISTSKTVASIWTYAVASALLSLVIVRWMGHGGALSAQSENGLQANYALLIGGPLGAAILAKAVVVGQLEAGTTSKADGDQPAASQLVSNDAGATDLGDLQYVLFNTVALVFFVGEFVRVPQEGLPDLPDLLVGLTSVSAVGYLGKKVLPQAPQITTATPNPATPGALIAIAGTGLVVGGNAPLQVLLDSTAIPVPYGIEHTPQGTVVQATIPANQQVGSYQLSVRNFRSVLITAADPLVVQPP
jgi:hypothetical protein